VNRLVPEPQLEATVNDLVARISAHSGPGAGHGQKGILGGMGLSLRDGLKNSMDIFLNQLYKLKSQEVCARWSKSASPLEEPLVTVSPSDTS